MTGRTDKPGYAPRRIDPDGWIEAGDAPATRDDTATVIIVRLTIDVAPAMRGSIKVAAFNHRITVADMPRELPARAFPDTSGERP